MRRALIGLLSVMLLVAACGADGGEDATTDLDDSGEAIGDSSDDAGGDGSTASEGAEVASRAPSVAEFDADAGDQAIATQEVGLQAGSVDDNERWEAYLRYREAFALLGIPFADLPVEGRRLLTVTDGDGVPVLDAVITVDGPDRAWTLRTGADGRAVFLPPPEALDEQQAAPTFEATVRHGEVVTTAEIGPEQQQTIVLEDVEHDRAVRLDVLFLIDATGSMSDEIERLKANMVGVAEAIDESPTAPDVRFAVTSYRDTEDEYLSRTVDFTSDVGTFVETLRGLVADGGGDAPEALNEAFAEAVGAPSWRTDDDVVRLVFLIADAPPHIGRGPSYVESIGAAAAAGIRVYPIASSGTVDQAEYVFRQIAQATLGRFVFLSYGAGGAALGGETDIEPDEYDVLALDELIVRLVEEELAPLADR